MMQKGGGHNNSGGSGRNCQMWAAVFGAPKSCDGAPSTAASEASHDAEGRRSQQQQDIGSKNVRFEAGSDGLLPKNVKNTFVHFPVSREDEEDSQPSASRSISGPGRFYQPQADDEKRIDKQGRLPAASGEVHVQRTGLADATPVKNTFIHYPKGDDEDQPDMERRSLSGPARPDVPKDAPVYLHYDKAEQEDDEEEVQPPIFRSTSGPGRVSASADGPSQEDDYSNEDEQPPVRRCISGPSSRHEPVKVPVKVPVPKAPKRASPDTVHARARSNDGANYRDLSPLSHWLGLSKDDPYAVIGDWRQPPAAGAIGQPPPPSMPNPWMMPGYMAPTPFPVPFAPGMPFPDPSFYQHPPGWMPPVPMMSPLAGSFGAATTSPPSAQPNIADQDGDQSPIAAWLGLPKASKRTGDSDPFGFGGAAPEPKDIVVERKLIPEGAELPSLGAALHNEGNCKPCAHNWKPGGCSNGKNCKFCHACDGDAFKRCKKEKVSRLRE